jgi:cold shock CspA family protein
MIIAVSQNQDPCISNQRIYYFTNHITLLNMSRVEGTVKWFSNKKGYGFVEPTSEGATTTEDIFVHQSSVKSDGYRTLVSVLNLHD